MGEAKRRKQLLGSCYGKPLGLSSAERIELIDSDIAQWISQHLSKCEYYNYLEKPFALQTRANSLSESNLEQVIENVAEHFSVTFGRTYALASIESLVRAILKDRPIVFEGVSLKQGRIMEPTVALPEARKYFQQQVEAGKIELSIHQILIKEALIVLVSKTKASLLKQLLWGEFNEVVNSAQQEQASWLMKNVNADGWIDLSDELLFQSVNRVIVGILTIVATLPWSMHLELVNRS